ncbi:hypothetical protein DPMN_186706 [Dreissena polymorpha]|uniref:Uncharacterized protein n=1 Tax=Dreissena polymorpha TaxID=45954 RepID=A0A9D4I6S2_DREPO|nr:hypothetical protein DPMN_186706 [Dreissena polymorpha]
MNLLRAQKNIPSFLDSRPYCNVIFQIPNNTEFYPETCQVKINKCNLTTKWRDYDSFIDKACLSYTSIFKDKYKNVHCFLCNEHSDDTEFSAADTCLDFEYYEYEIPWLISFTSLLDFSKDGDLTVDATEDESLSHDSCGSDAVIDPFTNTCRQLSCAKGFAISQNYDRCTPEIKGRIAILEPFYGMNIQLQIVPTKTAHLDDILSLAEFVEFTDRDLSKLTLFFSENTASICGSRSFIKLKKPVMAAVGDIIANGTFDENIELLLFDIYLDAINVNVINLTNIIQEISSLLRNQMIGLYKIEFVHFNQSRFAPHVNPDLSQSALTNISNTAPVNQRVFLKRGFGYSFNEELSGNAILPIYPNYVPKCSTNIIITPSPFCSRITLTPDNESEYVPSTGETLLTNVTISKTIVSFDSYIRMLDGNISVCWEVYREKLTKSLQKVSPSPLQTTMVFGYISVICLSISIASLIATLIVYS